MDKLSVAIIAIAVTVYVAWQKRIDLLVWGLPKVTAFTTPVAANRDVDWPAGPADRAAHLPNVILLVADDLGFNDVSYTNGGAGDGSVMTPHIDALAHGGATFANGYAANAVCAPSRAALMTGRYATRFGFEFTPFFRTGATIVQWMQQLEKPPLPSYVHQDALEQLPDMDAMGMPASEVTIAETLRAAGYYTAHIGKWHLGAADGMHPLDQGFDDSLNMAGLLYLPEDDPRAVNAKRETDGIERLVWANAQYAAEFNRSEPFRPHGYLTDYYTDAAVEVIESNRHRPFFLYLAQWAVNSPLQALVDDYDALAHIDDHHLRVYAAMIRSLDRSVGRVVDALQRTGALHDTLIAFTSDNGGAGYIGLPHVNRPYRGWKLTLFEGGLHVPFVLHWPARIPAATRIAAPVHHVDLFHTFAAAAGTNAPTDRRTDGVDLMRLVDADATVPPRTLYWREGYHQAVLHDGWKLIRSNKPVGARWLFHLAEDPTERNNLADTHPERLAALERLLDTHNAEQAAPLWPSVIESPQLIDKHGGQAYEPGDEYVYWPN